MHRYLWILLLVLLIAACSTDPDPEQSSENDENAEPSPTATGPTNTPLPVNTLPPTWTPPPDGFQPTDAPTATRGAQNAANDDGLPPTWTPIATVQREAGGSSNPGLPTTATPTAEPTEFVVEDVCFFFDADDQRNEVSEVIDEGQGTTIYWQPLPDDEFVYIFQLVHPSGDIVLEVELPAAQSEYEIDAEFFNTPGAIYGWQLIPERAGVRTCFPISGDIFVNQLFLDENP